MQCAKCASEIPGNSKFCLSCGTPVSTQLTSAATMAMAAVSQVSGSRMPSWPSIASGPEDGRFPPGIFIAERYRILGVLGKGGMGEVYRATDVRLGQTVALKFLPEAVSKDPATLTRFYNEVRIARQVTHPNVCRVFDIGEWDGQPFLSMQFVDGENLASLLMRIGRLPGDKAVEIARRLCAGLAAAHQQNVLHRDLKPANIMIDGRGQVIITDFGLAGFSEDIRGNDVASGTPAYMAPEQLAGKEVTFKSDIYSLGLVLYEIFTGRRAFEAETLAELIRLREESRPADISSVVREIDPAVERVILRCLDPDPAARPSSALAISAALPGGDPLAAALAAGETPSPEMVAAAGAKEAMRPAVALSLLGVIFVLLAIIPIYNNRFLLLGRIDLEMPSEALAVEARKLAAELGAPRPNDSTGSFENNLDYAAFEAALRNRLPDKRDFSNANLNSALPVIYFYRQSPRLLIATNATTPGQVTNDDPVARIVGMAQVNLDTAGHLIMFSLVPPGVAATPPSSAPGDPSRMFQAAGLDLKIFQPTEPRWTPPVPSTARAAWTGPYPGRPGDQLRVEAAWWDGKPVWFRTIPPWAAERNTPKSITERFDFQEFILILAASGLAFRNIRSGRGDRQGAFRLAAFTFVAALLTSLTSMHALFSARGVELFNDAVALSLLFATQLWLAYMALEPSVRRRWPRILISWSRVTTGKWRDPVVARDILAGILVGLGYSVIFMLGNSYSYWRGAGPDNATDVDSIMGLGTALHAILSLVVNSVASAFVLFLLLFVLRLILRIEWLAAAVFASTFAAMQLLNKGGDFSYVSFGFLLIVYGAIGFVLIRFGLVSLVLAIFTVNSLNNLAWTTDLTAWYGTGTLVVLLVIAGISVFAFRRAIGNQPVFGRWLES